MTTASQIRSTFLEYFKKNGHEVVKSAPLVPNNDPTLMFVNAGMVPFKNVFTGSETRPYKTATSSQKCVRAGGKHNDLDNVGYTARHHTFFEMLGNFSFGDYFKENAIEHAWNLITKEYGLPKDRLLATVYSEDDEAYDLWKKISGFSDSKIIRIPTKDNFWSMGDTGPCGPCSEIFFDHGEKVQGGPPGSPDEDGDRFIEIWNLVFMQFDQQEDGSRLNLPKPSIDTGMGLERMAAVLQGKHNNYDIDLMRALILASASESNTDPDGDFQMQHRIIADHLRSSCFLIADGVLPSNEGRGYVLRRIMRRAMRQAHLMGCVEPLMYRLVPALVSQMGEHYSELGRAQALITETLKLEESRFKQTLGRGLRLLDDETACLTEGGVLSGEVAFKLYDTYGFPLDLTQDALRSKGMTVDEDGFNNAMAKQKADARKAWSGSGDAATDEVWFDLHEELGASEFVGYNSNVCEGQVTALVVDGKPVEKALSGEVMLVANQTSFYGEAGGQMGDAGSITFANGAVVEVTDTVKKLGDMHVHIGKLVGSEIKIGDVAEFAVNEVRRDAIRANHSATHLLHAALRRTLGDHVTQKGSSVGPDRLRFDISHPKAISLEELRIVEAEVNRRIRMNREVLTKIMAQEEAVESGAMALFGEKYGDEVRVVTMGGEDLDVKRPNFSVELCGGTHVRRTGDIGYLKIVSESAVGAGVRRIEAVTGVGAEEYIEKRLGLLDEAASNLKTRPSLLSERVLALLEERKNLERKISDLQKKLATGGSGAEDEVEKIGDINYVGKVLDGIPAKDLRGMTDAFKKKIGSGVILLVSVNAGKASITVGVTDDLKDKISAVDLVRVASSAVGGKGGGGRPDMAQAGGPDGSKASVAVAEVRKALAE